MRILLIAHNVYTEHTNGAARSVRTIMEWLHDGKHDCHAVTSGRFDQTDGVSIHDHHDNLGVELARVPTGARSVVRYRLNGVSVSAVETLHADRLAEDEAGNQIFAAEIAEALEAGPDIVLAYGYHLLVHAGLKFARTQGARTIFTVRAWGYNQRSWFENADRVLVNSTYAARAYARRPGVHADALPSPFVWPEIEAPVETRGFVTFVNPSLHKGLMLIARLAEMLGRRRPDIPILIVQSGGDASILNSIPELDLARQRQILVSPALPEPRQIFALTRILLVPSTFAEPFGRVAAEAMINGIPPLVSDRGGLPETVGRGGTVLKLPDWLGPETRQVPSEAETQPWFDALVRLWDDPGEYARASAAALSEAKLLYAEQTLRARYLAYFEEPPPYKPVIGEPAGIDPGWHRSG
jgi:glycosyltransferase involved in cell wall biosynthesis